MIYFCLHCGFGLLADTSEELAKVREIHLTNCTKSFNSWKKDRKSEPVIPGYI